MAERKAALPRGFQLVPNCISTRFDSLANQQACEFDPEDVISIAHKDFPNDPYVFKGADVISWEDDSLLLFDDKLQLKPPKAAFVARLHDGRIITCPSDRILISVS